MTLVLESRCTCVYHTKTTSHEMILLIQDLEEFLRKGGVLPRLHMNIILLITRARRNMYDDLLCPPEVVDPRTNLHDDLSRQGLLALVANNKQGKYSSRNP